MPFSGLLSVGLPQAPGGRPDDPWGRVPTARCISLPARMTRRSLRPHLNQIRSWVRQGRTDAWIAHQLEVTVQQIEEFKRENELAPDDSGEGGAGEYSDEFDLRAEDDALVAAELEAVEAETSASEEEQIVIRRAGSQDEDD